MEGRFGKLNRRVNRWRGPIALAVPLVIGLYESWKFSHSFDLGLLGVVVWGAVYLKRRRYDRPISRWGRWGLIYAPRVIACGGARFIPFMVILLSYFWQLRRPC
jgi:hypothetical protein